MGREREHFGLSRCYKDQVNGSRSEGWSQSSGRAEGWAGEPRTKGCEGSRSQTNKTSCNPQKVSPGGLEEDIQVLPLRTLISFTHLFFGCEGLSQGLVHIVSSLLCPFIG